MSATIADASPACSGKPVTISVTVSTTASSAPASLSVSIDGGATVTAAGTITNWASAGKTKVANVAVDVIVPDGVTTVVELIVQPGANGNPHKEATAEVRVTPPCPFWAMYNFDAAGTRFNAHETVLGPDTVGSIGVKWTLPTAGLVTATPAIQGDTVYVGDFSGAFYAINANTGALRWRTQVTNSSISASALVQGNRS